MMTHRLANVKFTLLSKLAELIFIKMHYETMHM